MENLQDELNDYKNINHQAYKNNANDSDHRQTGLDWFNSQMLRLRQRFQSLVITVTPMWRRLL